MFLLTTIMRFCYNVTCQPSDYMRVQIVHSLRTHGRDYDAIDEISLVVPCLEMAGDYGYTDLQQPQPGCLRAYKTHLPQQFCPYRSDVKYIFVARNPEDVRARHLCITWLQHTLQA
jgi:hypothetical protein